MTGNKSVFFFTNSIIKWDKSKNLRVMPWKGEKDPYKIWLSEIILQQTRVEQGRGYYNRIIEKYPSVEKLAAAPEKEVFKLWEGLGYYTRCKNLIYTAKFISEKLNGKFPDDYQSILNLKGIGPYTAAAIASFAFNLPYAVVDGNVMRLLSRFFGIKTAIDTTEGKKLFNELANKLIEKRLAGLYNQAIMDFGATICKPQQPQCSACVLSAKCFAFVENAVNEYPQKSKKLVKKHRWFYYILAEYDGSFFIKKRLENDIWQNLHEFILIESDRQLSNEQLFDLPDFKNIAGKIVSLVDISKIYKQQLTHQSIQGSFIHVTLKKPIAVEGYRLEKKATLLKLAFPKFINAYFDDSPGIFKHKSLLFQ
jgi:A/G-specific adenine glycosylase